jgi:cytochrome c-type biogenesis protein CcmH/NrfG
MRYSFVADHFQYLAIVALIVPVAVIAEHFLHRAAFVLLIPLAILSFRQCLNYHDERTLWADTISKNYHSWMTHVSLGQQLEATDPTAAEREFKIAVAVEPSEADAWWRLGEFEGLHNHLDQAELCFRRALADDPNHPGAIIGLRTVLRQENKITP